MDTPFAHLAQFSDWTLSILPRLFLYPGGLWMLVMVLWMRLLREGRRALGLDALVDALVASRHLPAAVAWVGLALLPLPGTAALPFPVDRFALAGLLLTSFLSSLYADEGARPPLFTSVSVAMLLAVMAPVASGRALLVGNTGQGLSDWISFACILVGLCVLSVRATAIEGDLRWLAWLGLAGAPLWAQDAPAALSGTLWSSLIYGVSILVLVGTGRLTLIERARSWLPVMCWGLAVLSLMLALLG